MADTTLKVILDPETRKLDRALKGRKIGVGGGEGPSQKKQEKNSGLMVGMTKKLLGTLVGIAAILTSLDFVIRPLAAILTAVMTLFFLPLVPIVSKIVEFFTKTSKAITKAPQFEITGEEGLIGTILKSLANVLLRIGAFFIEIGKEIGQWIFDKIIKPAGDFISGIIIGVGNFIAGILIKINSVIIKGFFFFRNIGNKIWEGIIKPGFNFLLDVGKKIWDIIKGGFDFIKTALKNVANAIIGLLNKLPGINIPTLAAGGIVTRPTLAVIGEKGPEAVIPLNQTGGLGGLTININNPVVREERDLRKIADQISRIMMQGKLRGFAPNF